MLLDDSIQGFGQRADRARRIAISTNSVGVRALSLQQLGHFFQKEGNLRGAFSTQRLIANFLMAAVRKR